MKTLIAALFLGLCVNITGQFTATLTNTVGGQSREFKVYADLNNYRYEFEEDGQKGIYIAFPGKNRTWLLMPEKKYIYKTTADDFRMLANDPVAAIKIYSAYGEVTKTGKEKVSGYDCEVTDYHQGDTKVYTAWHATSLNFIIKAVNHLSDDSFMEVTDIKKWKVDQSLFAEPEGYTEVDDRMKPKIPEPPPPSEWATVHVELPVTGSYERGTKVRFVVNHDKHTKVKFTNETESPAKVIYYQSDNGVTLPEAEIGPASFRTHRLMKGEFKTLTFNLEKGKELTVEVHEGSMKMEAGPE